MQKRVSNRGKQNQLQTKYLEDQTKKMQQKLAVLKKQVDEQKRLKETNPLSTVQRWRSNTRGDVPLKDYAKKVLQEQKDAYKKFGVNEKTIVGTKTFSSIKSKLQEEKMEEERKNPKKLTSLGPNITEEHQAPTVSIHNNFWKAKMQTDLIKQKTLEEFLQQNHLLKYLSVLQEDGISTLDDLANVSKDRLAALGIIAGHQVKLIKRAKEELQKVGSNSKADGDKEEKGEKRGAVEFAFGDGNVLHAEDFDEKEEEIQHIEMQSKSSFLKSATQFSKKSQSQSPQAPQQQETYSDEYEDEVLITNPLANMQQQADITIQKQYCFSCYKLCPQLSVPIPSKDDKMFCSPKCFDSYSLQMQKTCPECAHTFWKTDGFFEQGLWFCSVKCCPNQEEIEEMFIDWNHGK